MLSSIPVFLETCHNRAYWHRRSPGAAAAHLPLITHLCTPADLGAFTVWLVVTSIASIVATLRLKAAMILDHDQREQTTLFLRLLLFFWRPCH